MHALLTHAKMIDKCAVQDKERIVKEMDMLYILIYTTPDTVLRRWIVLIKPPGNKYIKSGQPIKKSIIWLQCFKRLTWLSNQTESNFKPHNRWLYMRFGSRAMPVKQTTAVHCCLSLCSCKLRRQHCRLSNRRFLHQSFNAHSPFDVAAGRVVCVRTRLLLLLLRFCSDSRRVPACSSNWWSIKVSEKPPESASCTVNRCSPAVWFDCVHN